MRKLSCISIALSVLLLCTSVAGAYSMWDIGVGDYLMVTGYNSTNNAGEYEMKAKDGDSGTIIDFTSWCAQQNEYLNTDTWYEIKDLLTPMDESAYLLSQYYSGVYSFTGLGDEADFQNALWSYDNGKTGISNTYTNLADTAAAGGWKNDGYVFIADLGSKQDLYVPGQPIPEPATMILFGTGLIGLAAIGRRKLS